MHAATSSVFLAIAIASSAFAPLPFADAAPSTPTTPTTPRTPTTPTLERRAPHHFHGHGRRGSYSRPIHHMGGRVGFGGMPHMGMRGHMGGFGGSHMGMMLKKRSDDNTPRLTLPKLEKRSDVALAKRSPDPQFVNAHNNWGMRNNFGGMHGGAMLGMHRPMFGGRVHSNRFGSYGPRHLHRRHVFSNLWNRIVNRHDRRHHANDPFHHMDNLHPHSGAVNGHGPMPVPGIMVPPVMGGRHGSYDRRFVKRSLSVDTAAANTAQLATTTHTFGKLQRRDSAPELKRRSPQRFQFPGSHGSAHVPAFGGVAAGHHGAAMFGGMPHMNPAAAVAHHNVAHHGAGMMHGGRVHGHAHMPVIRHGRHSSYARGRHF